MKMGAQYFLLAAAAGVGVAVQFGVNGQLRRVSGQPIWASFVSFVVGTAALLLCFVATRRAWPSGGQFGHAPWWIWIGGLLGAFYVVVSVVAGPRLGSAALVACVIAGQLVASVVIDHFGWVGYLVHPISPGRIVGAILLLAGVACVLRY
ncbi:MAG: DMT family transporter [Chloroflexota bacterium]|nr:DMT family transporter [Chloroflexota bacterium]